MKGSSSEYEDIGIHKCSRINLFIIINKEVKVWTSSSKQQEDIPELTKTKEDIRLEQMKRKVRRVALEYDDFLLQEHLKSLMYVDLSSSGDPNKDKLIDELSFKNCVHLKRKTTSNFFVGIKYKKKEVYYSSRIF